MNSTIRVRLAVIGIGGVLCALAGVIAWCTVAALQWGLFVRLVAAAYVVRKAFLNVRNNWRTYCERKAHPLLRSRRLGWFFVAGSSISRRCGAVYLWAIKQWLGC